MKDFRYAAGAVRRWSMRLLAAVVASGLAFAAQAQVGVASQRAPAVPSRPNLPIVTARHGMVVTAQHLATQVGVDILKEGGNAVDAAVAVGYALAVVDPCCGNIGGGGFMTLHLADGRNLFLDFREKAPLAATPSMYLTTGGQVDNHRSLHTYLGVGVPGTVMGLDEALQKYGTMSLPEILAPAIKLAKDGFALEPGDGRLLDTSTGSFGRHANVAAIFLNHGQPWKAGEVLKQPQLAHTLELIAKGGTQAFYDGPIAAALVKASEAHHGLLTLADFRDYTAPWSKPLECDYHGYTIDTVPPPGGGTTICETMRIIAPYPLAKWGFHSLKSAHYFIEAERHAFADRNTYLGDPAFVHNPIAKLLSPANVQKIRADIQPDRATPSSEVKGSLGPQQGMNTTSYSVVDGHGNAVAVTYTVNSFFGVKRIAGDTGFFLNNEMNDFTSKPGVPNQFGLVQGKANAIEPGKRPLSSMTPTIVTRDGKLVMVTGSPGGSTIISTTMESILNVIEYHMNLKQAIDAPRIHMQWYPDEVIAEPGAFTPAVQAGLEKMGYRISYGFKYKSQGKTFTVRHLGDVEAIVVDPKTGLLEGYNDPRYPAGLAAGF